MISLPAVSTPSDSASIAGLPVMTTSEAGIESNPAVISTEGFASVLTLCSAPATPSTQPALPAVAPVVPTAPNSAAKTAMTPTPLQNPPGDDTLPTAVSTSRSLGLNVPTRPARSQAVITDEPESIKTTPDSVEPVSTSIPVELLAQAVIAFIPPAPVDVPCVRPVAPRDGDAMTGREGGARTLGTALPALADNVPVTIPPAPGAIPAVQSSAQPATEVVAKSAEAPRETARTIPSAPTVSAASATLALPTVQAADIAPKLAAPLVSQTPASATSEKIAATPVTPLPAGMATAVEQVNNKFLNVDNKIDAKTSKSAGIVNAKSTSTMRSPLSASPLQPAVKPVQTGDDAMVAAVQSRIGGGSETTLPGGDEPTLKISGHAIDAAGAVREVVEMTHEFRARERGSVEVNFDFKDNTQLSVRVALRNGDVQATFRTDSEELRATLSREWQGQTAVIAQESRGFRVAEPVFTGSGDFSDSSQNRQSGFSTGGDARQQADSSQSDSSAFHRTATPAGAFLSRSSSGSAPITTGVRVSPDRLLHAFA
jgi:hypothetical protein